ncbi:MAG: bifunctional nicotinamide-nucleotide adenylyltransferase/Nudix hydroxylase [Pseudomonadota bacterium]|nr:bifunctional nicotinamide-nucleotide adenylyltransferase/Nudix hydroxylase [Pseudomonadota bacterium]
MDRPCLPRRSRSLRVFDYLIFIGRFQPYHLGHQSVIAEALRQSRHVIVLLGSANLPRSTRNSFSVAERQQMILESFSPEQALRIRCVALRDSLYNDIRWVTDVQQAVTSVVGDDPTAKIGLIGHAKDRSSYYLSLFPHWQSVSVPNYHNLSATPIRDSYLLGAMPQPSDVPNSTLQCLQQFKQTAQFGVLQEEAWFIDKYKKQWERSPYPPTFVTVDAVVVQAGHILLVERQAMPGRGLWALPGGFIHTKESLLDACIRELREETRLKVPDPVLRGSMHAQRTFDDPYRSARGRTITQAFYFELRSTPEGLPKVRGADDAKRAFWLPLSQLDATQLFEDHYAIICAMAGL